MASSKILATNQTVTPDDDIIKGAWGEYHCVCQVYGSSNVNVQVRVAGETTWNNASFEGNEIVLSRAGDVCEVRMTPDNEYRVSTSAAGAEVWMSAYTIKHNPNP